MHEISAFYLFFLCFFPFYFIKKSESSKIQNKKGTHVQSKAEGTIKRYTLPLCMHGRGPLKPKLVHLDHHHTYQAKNPIMNPQEQPNPLAQPNLVDQPKLFKDYLNPLIGVETFNKPSFRHDIKP